MLEGTFVDNIPFVKLKLSKGKTILESVFVLDSGFSGQVQITPKIAQALSLKVNRIISTTIATGERIFMPVATAMVSMEDWDRIITVMISDGLPLIGVGLLSKFDYRAILDCKYKTVFLNRVA